MNSSNTENKNLSATIAATKQTNERHGTATTRTEDGRSPYFRTYREDQEQRRSTTEPTRRTRLVARLAGLLWALMDALSDADSRIDPEVATDQREDGDIYTERTAAKTDFGTRVEPVDGLYGYTSDGYPIAPLQHRDFAFLTLINIAEIADTVVGAVTAPSYKRVKLRI